jgi:hypothetical protein
MYARTGGLTVPGTMSFLLSALRPLTNMMQLIIFNLFHARHARMLRSLHVAHARVHPLLVDDGVPVRWRRGRAVCACTYQRWCAAAYMFWTALCTYVGVSCAVQTALVVANILNSSRWPSLLIAASPLLITTLSAWQLTPLLYFAMLAVSARQYYHKMKRRLRRYPHNLL